jgi:esterase
MFRVLVAVAVAVLLTSCQTVTPRTWDLPPQAKAMQANGYEVAFVERGTGPAVVLVHGTVTDYRYWAAQMEPLGSSHRVIALSLRHFYPERWDGKGSDFSVEQHARDLATFIKGLNVGPVHLVGHSRGGDVALLLAKAEPSLLRTLTLADPAPLEALLPKTPEAAAEANTRRTFISAAIERLEQGDIDGGLERFIDGVVATGAWTASPEPFRQSVRENAWSIKSLLTDAQASFTCTDAAAIKAPVLLITGERSPRPYGVMLEALSSCLTRHTKVTIPNAAHTMNRANPQAFNAAVLDFLATAR